MELGGHGQRVMMGLVMVDNKFGWFSLCMTAGREKENLEVRTSGSLLEQCIG